MNNRKPIFFTSDWHIGHNNIIEYDQRPFRDLNHMHEVLIKNYNEMVPENGICYFLGDVGLTNNTQINEVINKLHGMKVLILGNHDKGYNAMYDNGFDCVLNSASINLFNEKITMSHCPLIVVYREGDELSQEKWHREQRNAYKFSVHNEDQFHLHGHCHKTSKDKIKGKQFDVGVRANNYKPVSITIIESFISKYKKL